MPTLYVRDASGFREAQASDVLDRAQALLSQRYRPGSPVLSSPSLTREFLRMRLGARDYEIVWPDPSRRPLPAHCRGGSLPRHDRPRLGPSARSGEGRSRSQQPPRLSCITTMSSGVQSRAPPMSSSPADIKEVLDNSSTCASLDHLIVAESDLQLRRAWTPVDAIAHGSRPTVVARSGDPRARPSSSRLEIPFGGLQGLCCLRSLRLSRRSRRPGRRYGRKAALACKRASRGLRRLRVRREAPGAQATSPASPRGADHEEHDRTSTHTDGSPGADRFLRGTSASSPGRRCERP